MPDMATLDLNLLAALDALLRDSSVTRAAQRLGQSTPAMSRALSRLRVLLADPLLVRAGHAMVLTPRAQALQPRVQAALAEAVALLAPERAFEPAELARSFLIRASDHPLGVLGPALDWLAATEAPGWCCASYRTSMTTACRQRLLGDRFVCVVRRDHPTVGKALTLEQFVALGHVQVAPRQGIGNHIDRALAERGQARRVVRAVP